MKKNKNAFTLIELLAIIVILAIIAVITVPIILNIIDNSKKGVATESARGYKDSVNKYYMSMLTETDGLNLDGTYEVKTDGVLKGNFGVTENDEERTIPVDGTKPSGGKLIYLDNVFKGGCLAIGEYAVTFNNDGTTSTTIGNCSDYEYSSLPTIAEMCPGCVFTINTVDEEKYIGVDTVTNYETDYTRINNNIFLGYILDENTHVIQKAYLCGINRTKPFCIEKTSDSEKLANNISILNQVFSNYETNGSAHYFNEDNYSFTFNIFSDYSLEEGDINSQSAGLCGIDGDNRTGCYSS